VCEKFASKNPSIVDYDEKMILYYKTIEEILALPKEKEIEFVRLGMRSLCESMAYHAKEWMKCLAQQLNESAKKRLFEIKVKLEVNLFSELNYSSYKIYLERYLMRKNLQKEIPT
jgi:formylmethanofuran dehydrogenase subunit B